MKKYRSENIAIVTGGSGFIGQRLCEVLSGEGLTVHNIDIKHQVFSNKSIKTHICNIMDSEKIRAFLAEIQPTHMYHLAAMPSLNARHCSEFQDILKGTEICADAFADCSRARVFCNISTQLVIKPKMGFFDLKEFDPYTPYGEAKAIAENNLDRRSYPFRTIHLRPTNIWGPRHPSYGDTVLKYLAKRVYLQPKNADLVKRTYGYVQNSAEQIGKISLCESIPDKAVFYIGDAAIETGLYLDKLSMALTGKNVRRMPTILLSILAKAGDAVKPIIPHPPFDQGRYYRMTTNYIVPLENTLKICGAGSVPFERGIAETVKWYETLLT